MYRTLVIVRHTFREAVVQPIYTLLLAIAAGVLIVFSVLPFFTLGDDTVMFKSVGLDLVLLFVLLSTLFATSKSIYDEIEDRTMLTLMSKPVRKWEVLIGKYLGIVLAAGMAIGVLGVTLILCTWWRIPNDYFLSTNTLDDRIVKQLSDLRWMHVAGLVPSLVLVWLQVSVLAAIGVALSTRFSLVVNLPAVLLIYIAGNLTRFLPLRESSPLARGFAEVVATVMPFLRVFDFRETTVYRELAIPGTEYADAVAHPHAVGMGFIAAYLGVALLYAIAYAGVALGSGLLIFERRELGGAEG
jgi:ABC-type transport system involved in multi-copper enzyme maturation permease subunit